MLHVKLFSLGKSHLVCKKKSATGLDVKPFQGIHHSFTHGSVTFQILTRMAYVSKKQRSTLRMKHGAPRSTGQQLFIHMYHLSRRVLRQAFLDNNLKPGASSAAYRFAPVMAIRVGIAHQKRWTPELVVHVRAVFVCIVNDVRHMPQWAAMWLAQSKTFEEFRHRFHVGCGRDCAKELKEEFHEQAAVIDKKASELH
jgi:hypothetical protein